MQQEYQRSEREINKREIIIADLKEELYKQRERVRIQSELDTCTEENTLLEWEIKTIDTDQQQLAQDIERISTERDQNQKEADMIEQDMREKHRFFEQQKTIFQSLQTEIDKFIYAQSINKTGTLVYIEDKMKATLCEITQIKAEISKLDELIHTLEHGLEQTRSMERNCRDNIRWREMSAAVISLEEELQQMKAISATGGKSMEQEEDTIKSEQSTLRMVCSDLTSERASHLGEIKQLEEQRGRLERELLNDYKNIDRLYVEQLVKVKSTITMMEDLDRYVKVLDGAIMKYHACKMNEINKVIRELWVNTYQGSDIDTIEIRSDTADANGEVESSTHRSYHYRVVMIKGGDGVELDMRGRCSTGQRVLGSIMIRLALAESFGLNCGILALDEPTTNLDRANIESLAESLCRIIKSRRKQHNFQLIVITHDEDFVRLLGRAEFADYYWRISRDERQFSIIERQSITTNPT